MTTPAIPLTPLVKANTRSPYATSAKSRRDVSLVAASRVVSLMDASIVGPAVDGADQALDGAEQEPDEQQRQHHEANADEAQRNGDDADDQRDPEGLDHIGEMRFPD